MKLDINEEERDFLERVCDRAEKLAWLAKSEMDLNKIIILKNKLRELDANLINREITNERL